MAKAYQCDRCMAYYTANKEVVPSGMDTASLATGVDILTITGKKKTYELCDDCLKTLVDWVTFKPISMTK